MPRVFQAAAVFAFAAATWALPAAAKEDSASQNSVLRSDETRAAIKYRFAAEDAELLEHIERGCFQYLWKEVGSPSGLVKDRRYAEVASVAGVGFQLSALPIAVEHGWISRAQAEERALQALRTLRERDDNRREGVYLHFLRADDGSLYRRFNNEASTVDHALLLAGAMPAAVYFGGEVAEIVDRIAAEANWRAFVQADGGFLSMGWRPADNKTTKGPGELIPAAWRVASDEERIIYFLAAGSPKDEFALEAPDYYRLERHFRRQGDGLPFIASNSGTPFTYFFSHCWIDYRGRGADEPAKFGVDAPRVDWFENSRRALLEHRQRCIEEADKFRSFGADRWGVSPCMGFDRRGRPSYLVQEVLPNLFEREQWQGGTVAPYAAGGAIMFAPMESLAALRAYRELKNKDGKPLVWRDPADGGYGFADSFNLDQGKVSDDNVAIDVGPMLLAIENARTGLIWRLFMQHPVAKRAVEKLALRASVASGKE